MNRVTQMGSEQSIKECAHDMLCQLIYLIEVLFARSIDLGEFHPGIDDLGDGYKVKPQRHNFEQKKIYGKLVIIDDETESRESFLCIWF